MKRGDLVTVTLQGDHGKPRPAVIIRSDLFSRLTSTTTLAPLTSTARDAPLIRVPIEPSGRNGLRQRSYVMLDRISSPRQQCPGEIFGELDDSDMVALNRALALFVGITS